MIFPHEKCQVLYDGWLDYKEPYRGWVHQGPAKMSVDSYHAKAEERRKLVKGQLDGIMASCRAKGCFNKEVAA
ncbi:hypothetical protein [Arthrobacter sp. FW306-06-A]|uniref:hypothetical protein n=1 Tax=Arthrobacter sp. FW306-06-A TaxID=2879621 RepID=UPI001F3240FC|nr:hypothetical protein [Arthrobacter sp. FW306-06-A]UKA69555.1 hypothetical protein LFT49_12305 [Arthrobacter sp. FW306-06-A]